MHLCIVVSLLLLPLVHGLDNGLARTPPMGWMSWERFGCNTDCINYPQDCISEHLVRTTADALVHNGYKDAGYQYVALDDCWMAPSRDKEGKLQPDKDRFPTGIKALADYVHQRGLKFGIYLDVGNYTCQGYPGSWGHYETDANTLADWGVDMLKFDGCNVTHTEQYDTAYPEMGHQLNRTGRHIMYACEWPVYLRDHGRDPNYTAVGETCNMFRTHDDVIDSWENLKDIVKWYGDNSRQLSNHSGPGQWNDPDQLLVGDFGLGPNQQKMQMAIWSIMAAPLFVSADVRNMRPPSKAILLNKLAITINQDPLGVMGTQRDVIGEVHLWTKPITPKGSFALALLYTDISGGPKKVSVKLSDIGFTTAAAYNFTEVFDGDHVGIYKPWHTFDCEVNPTGVLFIHALALP